MLRQYSPSVCLLGLSGGREKISILGQYSVPSHPAGTTEFCSHFKMEISIHILLIRP